MIVSGPIGGMSLYPGTGKSLVVAISPLTNIPVDSNVGGYFGPLLKMARDGTRSKCKARPRKKCLIFIDGDEGRVTVEAAPGAGG